MALRWLLAALHLLGLGVGLGAIYGRSRALRGPLDISGLRRVFVADTWWGVAAGVWIVTGLLRALGGYEKGTDYAPRYAGISLLQTILVLLMLAAATGMARGFGAR